MNAAVSNRQHTTCDSWVLTHSSLSHSQQVTDTSNSHTRSHCPFIVTMNDMFTTFRTLNTLNEEKQRHKHRQLRLRERKRVGERDRPTKMGRQTDRQTDRQRQRESCVETCSLPLVCVDDILAAFSTNWWSNVRWVWRCHLHTDRHRQTDRQTDMELYTYTQANTYTYWQTYRDTDIYRAC